MQKKLPFVLIATLLGLAGCSQGSDLERALVGGAAGCLIGEIIDEGECVTGAVVGAAGGALADDI